MSTDVEIWLESIEPAVDLLLKQTGSLAPLRYSYGERAKKNDLIEDSVRFDIFRRGVSDGFYLHLARGKVNFDVSLRYPDSIMGSFRSPGDASDFLKLMAEVKPLYGFAADRSEYFAKHQLIHGFRSASGISQMVGLNLDFGIPGLHWKTLISSSILERHHLDLHELQEISISYAEVCEGQHLFQFYPTPKKWNEVERLGVALSAASVIFDIDEARRALPEVSDSMTFKEYREESAVALNRWRRRPL